jgi:hypothetical protein
MRQWLDFHSGLLKGYRKNQMEVTWLVSLLTKDRKTNLEKTKEKIEQLQFLNKTIRVRFYRIALCMLIPLLVAIFYYLFSPVRQTTITAKIVVSEIDFTLARDFESDMFTDFLRNSAVGKVEVRESRAEELENSPNDYLLYPDPGSQIFVPKIHIPKRSHVFLEQPFERSLRMSISTPDSNATVLVTTAIESARIVGERTALDTHIVQDERLHTGNVTFSKRMNNPKKFYLIVDELRNFNLNRIPTDQVFFRDIFESTDTSFSSIQHGIVHLNDTKEDSIVLSTGDKLEVTFAHNPVPLKVTHTERGLEVQFHATVSQLTTGAESVSYDKMPQQIKVLHDKKPWHWLLLSALVTTLIGMLKDFL